MQKKIGASFANDLAVAGLPGIAVAWSEDGTFSFGDVTDDQKAAVLAVYDAHNPAATIIPQSVTPFQGRKALRHQGLLEQVKAAIARADADTQDAFEYAISWERNSPFVLTMAEGLGWTNEQIDSLFILAATL